MALTPGSTRQPMNKEVVLVQARTSRETKRRIKEMADACGMSQGLFIEQLISSVPVDSKGRPEFIEIPDTDQKGLFDKAS